MPARLEDVGLRQPLAVKLPGITVVFWAAKVATTGVGEAASDWLGHASPVLAAVLLPWRRVEGTVSIHTTATRRRELFCWAIVLPTFALGTVAGDLVGPTLHLGFFPAGLLFVAAMVVPLAAWRPGVSPVVTSWTACVLTRPLGASFADWLGTPASTGGGVGFGDGPVTLVGVAVIVVLVAVTATRREDVEPGSARRGAVLEEG